MTARLAALADLHARGELTDEEYASAKARVLAGESAFEAGSPPPRRTSGVDSTWVRRFSPAASGSSSCSSVRYALGSRSTATRGASRSAIRRSPRAGGRRSASSFASSSRSSALIGVWSVLSVFPATQEVASAFLGLERRARRHRRTRPVDPARATSGRACCSRSRSRCGSATGSPSTSTPGIVDEISLSYTALTTDEGRRIFVPNTTMVSTIIVNRSVDDPRRLVTVELPFGSVRRSRTRAASRWRPPAACRKANARDLRPGGRGLREDRLAQRRRVCAVRRRRLAGRERDSRAGVVRARRGRLPPGLLPGAF